MPALEETEVPQSAACSSVSIIREGGERAAVAGHSKHFAGVVIAMGRADSYYGAYRVPSVVEIIRLYVNLCYFSLEGALGPGEEMVLNLSGLFIKIELVENI